MTSTSDRSSPHPGADHLPDPGLRGERPSTAVFQRRQAAESLVAGSLIFAAATFGCVVVPSMPVMVGFRFLLGLAVGGA
ncbi:hypothetical protein [Nocardia sp. BMG51109]|uniref:hypothetical protein n=1 Tax=Nocardia sp. BMG51109 TaxID=1056816 RepID=UPI0004656142|nr:hypothetical protein [Nocardia sp. BMG51109]